MPCWAHSDRHRAGQVLDAALGRGVGRDGGRASSLPSEPILMILPRLRGIMRLRRLAADHEGAGEVGLDHLAPFVGGELDQRLAVLDAGIVDENVDRDALAVEALEGRDDRGLVGDVERGARRPDVRRRETRPTACSTRLGSTPLTMILAPALASPSAMARPSPREEPVTSAVRPERSKRAVLISEILRRWSGARSDRSGRIRRAEGRRRGRALPSDRHSRP